MVLPFCFAVRFLSEGKLIEIQNGKAKENKWTAVSPSGSSVWTKVISADEFELLTALAAMGSEYLYLKTFSRTIILFL